MSAKEAATVAETLGIKAAAGGAGEIFRAIPAVMRDLEAIGKARRADTGGGRGYNFRGIDDVYNELHAHLAKHGVFTAPNVVDQRHEERPSRSGGLNVYRIFTICYTFYAADGSSVSAVVVGEGMDSGDKAANKAMAVAHKYALMQVFAIPTEDQKDPEAGQQEEHANAPAYPPREPPQARRAEPQRSAPSAAPQQLGPSTPFDPEIAALKQWLIRQLHNKDPMLSVADQDDIAGRLKGRACSELPQVWTEWLADSDIRQAERNAAAAGPGKPQGA